MAANERMYGNWRKPRSPGLGQLGSLGTAVLVAGMIVVIVTMVLAGLLPAVVLAAGLGVFLGLVSVRDRYDRSGLARISVRMGWVRARRTRANLYRSGPLGRVPWGTCQLPGLAAATRLSEARDPYDRPFALVQVPSTGHYTLVLAGEPHGASLVDQEQIDSWVAHWGAWLAALGDEPGIVGVSVTIETAPDTGARLRREVETNLDPRAPDVAQAMLREVATTYPQGAPKVAAWIAVTFSAAAESGGRRRSEADMARDLATRLPGLTSGLAATGAGAVRPATAADLCEMIRTAYDPDAGPLIDQAHADGQTPDLRWAHVGPTGAQAGWKQYRHDGAFSVTWSMSAAPRGQVFSSVLAQLLAPHPQVDRKRVTLLYRPIDTATAAKIVESDRRAADFRATATDRPSARLRDEQYATAATAAEEARGAGLVNFGMLVTATVTGHDRLPETRAAINNLAATARIQLRPVYGSQDSAFAAALPLGLVLPRHLSVPTSIRDAL